MGILKVKVISLPYIFQVLYALCFTRPRYQVSVYRTIGPLVLRILRSEEGGKKKNTKFFLLFNLKHIWISEKKKKKNCMILHCKNAEMTIILSFLHFYSVKSYNFCYFFLIINFFLNLAIFLHRRK